MRYRYSRHFLQHQHMAAQVGLQRRAEQLAEESMMLKAAALPRRIDRRLERAGRAGRPASPAPAPPPPRRRRGDVGRHRPMRDVRRSRCLEPGEQEPRRRNSRDRSWSRAAVAQLRQHLLGDPAGAIAAAREPDRVERRIVGELDEAPRRAPRRRRRNGRRRGNIADGNAARRAGKRSAASAVTALGRPARSASRRATTPILHVMPAFRVSARLPSCDLCDHS